MKAPKIKVVHESCGRKYALLVPSVIDDEGYIVISATQAVGASTLLHGEARVREKEYDTHGK